MPGKGGEDVSRPEENCAHFAEGKRLRNQDLPGAIEAFALALEEKADKYGTDVHPDLAAFWLEYGDCLLRSQENDVLGGNGDAHANAEGDVDAVDAQGEDDGDEQSGEEDAEEDVDGDSQLCWESLETARRCLELLPETPKKQQDLSFVHLRLGDFLGLSERFSEAAVEYKAALDIRRQVDSADLAGAREALVPLAQMATYQCKWAESLIAYSEAAELTKAQLRGEGNRPVDEQNKSDLESLLKDIEVEQQLCKERIKSASKTDSAASKSVSVTSEDGSDSKVQVLDLGTFGRKRSRAAFETDSPQEPSQLSTKNA